MLVAGAVGSSRSSASQGPTGCKPSDSPRLQDPSRAGLPFARKHLGTPVCRALPPDRNSTLRSVRTQKELGGRRGPFGPLLQSGLPPPFVIGIQLSTRLRPLLCAARVLFKSLHQETVYHYCKHSMWHGHQTMYLPGELQSSAESDLRVCSGIRLVVDTQPMGFRQEETVGAPNVSHKEE